MSRPYKLFKSPIDARDILHVPNPEKLPAQLPVKVDLRPEMPPVLNQSTLGSCALNATSNALRHLLKKEGKGDWQPSRLYLYWNTRVNIEHSPADEDTGVCIRDVCKALSKYHACREIYWPYIVSKFSEAPPLEAYKNADLHKGIKYAYVPQTIVDMKQTLAAGHPIMIGIQVYESLETQQVMATGVVPMPDVNTEKCLGGHCVLCCGYDDETRTFIFENSWGANVGQGGYFTIPYDYVLDPALASDFWVIAFFD